MNNGKNNAYRISELVYEFEQNWGNELQQFKLSLNSVIEQRLWIKKVLNENFEIEFTCVDDNEEKYIQIPIVFKLNESNEIICNCKNYKCYCYVDELFNIIKNEQLRIADFEIK